MSDLQAERRFGARVRQARTERGWSQRELAADLAAKGIKLDPSAITRLEKGQRPIRLDEAATLAEIFGIPLEEMIKPPTGIIAEAANIATQLAALLADAEGYRTRLRDVTAQAGGLAEIESSAPEADPELVDAHFRLVRAIRRIDDFDARVVTAHPLLPVVLPLDIESVRAEQYVDLVPVASRLGMSSGMGAVILEFAGETDEHNTLMFDVLVLILAASRATIKRRVDNTFYLCSVYIPDERLPPEFKKASKPEDIS